MIVTTLVRDGFNFDVTFKDGSKYSFDIRDIDNAGMDNAKQLGFQNVLQLLSDCKKQGMF